MNDIKVRLVSKKWLREKWHIQVVGSNGEIILWSENYINRADAEHIGDWLAGLIGTTLEIAI